MPYEKGICLIANPYAEENSSKFNCMEVVLPRTGEIKFLCKLPQNLFMPGIYLFIRINGLKYFRINKT